MTSEEPVSETTQSSTSTTRAGSRKYNSFVRTGAPRRPGLRVGTTTAPVTTTSTTTQRPRGTRRPSQLASGAAGVRGRLRARPAAATTEASDPTSDADAPAAATPEHFGGRRRGPGAGSRTPPSALSNEVLDSDHQESVQPPRSSLQRFESRRRPQGEAATHAAQGGEAEQAAAPEAAPQRVRVRRPGHRRQPTTAPGKAPSCPAR